MINIIIVVPFALGILLGVAVHVFQGMCDTRLDRVLMGLSWLGLYLFMVGIFSAIMGWLFLVPALIGTAVSLTAVYMTKRYA